jgi:hypothetical protein
MSDDDLARYLCLSPDEAAIILPKLTPERRAVYERMSRLEADLFLWEQGLGPKPQDVLIDYERKAFR